MNRFTQKSGLIQALVCLSLLALIGTTTSAAIPTENRDVQVTATASRNTIGVADPVKVTIQAIAPEGVNVRFPEVGQQVGDFEITNHQDTFDVPSPQGRKYQRSLTLETLTTGELNVPEFEIFFKENHTPDAAMETLKTPVIPITVQSSISTADNPSEFHDIKNVVFLDEPATTSSVPWGLFAALGGLGGVGVLGLVVANRFWKKLTPKQRALRSLDQLDESGSLSSHDSKLIYEQATQILSTFIEDQFDFPATRQTTEEFLVAVKSDRRLSEPLQNQLMRFLESADMVKFAGLSCSPEVLKAAIDNARQFVLQADQQRIAAAKQQPSSRVKETPVREISATAPNANISYSSSLEKETV